MSTNIFKAAGALQYKNTLQALAQGLPEDRATRFISVCEGLSPRLVASPLNVYVLPSIRRIMETHVPMNDEKFRREISAYMIAGMLRGKEDEFVNTPDPEAEAMADLCDSFVIEHPELLAAE